MDKPFDSWNANKKKLHKSGIGPFYHEREVWWCSIGVNVGFEQDGTGKNFDRPVVILKGFSKDVFIGVPLTGKKKSGKFYMSLGNVDGREASAILSQLRLFDAKRLIRKIGTVDENTFEKMRMSIANLLGLK